MLRHSVLVGVLSSALISVLACGGNSSTGPTATTPTILTGSCGFSISSAETTRSVAADGGVVTIHVTTSSPASLSACSWTVTLSDDAVQFVTLEDSALASSSASEATVSFDVGKNTGGERRATVTVAGVPFTIVQASAACVFSLAGDVNASFPAAGGSGRIAVARTQGGTCAWTAAASPSASFVTITSGASGTNDGTVTYTVGRNTGAAREGTLTVANQAVKVTQAAAEATGLTVSPTSVTFGTVNVGDTSAAQTITISNPTSAGFGTPSTSITGDYAIQTNGCNSALGAASRCEVAIVFKPTTGGVRSGTLTFTVPGAPNSPVTVQLSGTGAAGTPPSSSPTLTVSASTLNFGTVNVGAISPTQTVSLTNPSNVAFGTSSASITGDFVLQNNFCNSGLVALSHCEVTVAFKPIAGGDRSGVLTFTVPGAANSPVVVQLGGVGAAPALPTSPTLTVSASSLNFGTVNVGATSSTQTVTLTNPGNVNLATSSVSITGDFVVQNDFCSSGLVALSHCDVVVAFKPTAAGTRTGTLTFTVPGASNSPVTVQLSGAGASPPPAPALTASPNALNFGTVDVGVTSTTQTVSLTNPSTVNLSTSSASVNGDFVLQSNFCNSGLVALSHCEVVVAFKPTVAGARSGALTFTIPGAGNTPVTVPLSGVGR